MVTTGTRALKDFPNLAFLTDGPVIKSCGKATDATSMAAMNKIDLFINCIVGFTLIKYTDFEKVKFLKSEFFKSFFKLIKIIFLIILNNL